MALLLIISLAIVFILLVLLASLKPVHSHLSRFELARRCRLGDDEANNALKREDLLVDIISLQRVLTAVMLVIFVLLSVVSFGWLFGVIIAVLVALEYGSIARLEFMRSLSNKIYLRLEPKIISLINKFPIVFRVLRNVPAGDLTTNQRIDSREELQHLINESQDVLTPDEKKLIVHGLSFGDQLVSSVMTPRSVIDSIKSTEFLGPLTLDMLHKTGHSRLPVVKGDIDHVVGILHINNLLSLDIKKSTLAEKAMDSKVYYIREDQTLQHALAAFIRTHHHMFIVVNEFRETVGLITLEDVIEALLGRKIVDEFDTHDNLREVALRNPRGNNRPEKREDV